MTPAIATVRSSNLAEFRRFVLALDIDPNALMRRAGIEKRYFDDSELTLPAKAVAELIELASMMSGIDDFGLRFGEARGLPDFGPVILMLREQSTLRDALRTLVAFLHLHSTAYYPRLEEGEYPSFGIDFMVGGTSYYRQTMEATVASLAHVLRWLLGDEWVPTSVSFKHKAPASIARYDRFFRCPIHFLQDFNGFVFRRRELDKRLPASSPAQRRHVERYLRTINVAASDAYAHQVTQVVAMALPRGQANAEEIARYLGTTRRTLHNRLLREGLNYSAVLESVRKELSTQYMLSGERPLAAVADLLGFNSPSAFTHWFAHAFGCAPSLWRMRLRKRSAARRSITHKIKKSSQ